MFKITRVAACVWRETGRQHEEHSQILYFDWELVIKISIVIKLIEHLKSIHYVSVYNLNK